MNSTATGVQCVHLHLLRGSYLRTADNVFHFKFIANILEYRVPMWPVYVGNVNRFFICSFDNFTDFSPIEATVGAKQQTRKGVEFRCTTHISTRAINGRLVKWCRVKNQERDVHTAHVPRALAYNLNYSLNDKQILSVKLFSN